MTAYYNEINPYAAQWLRNLISAGHIARGDVDERSIADVRPDDLRNYAQCHFFAGIGGWSYALRLAGWPDDRECWTGSCPCQPLSRAGRRKGHADRRHLWPAFFDLIAERRPPIVFGEQVDSPLGREWIAGIRADLEETDFASGVADLCAACVRAPHIRQRLYWGAYSLRGRDGPAAGNGNQAKGAAFRFNGRSPWPGAPIGLGGPSGGLGIANGNGRNAGQQAAAPSRHWDSAIPTSCRDGKQRRIEPSIQPLAHGIPERVEILRASGNAIVPQVAAEFIRACRE